MALRFTHSGRGMLLGLRACGLRLLVILTLLGCAGCGGDDGPAPASTPDSGAAGSSGRGGSGGSAGGNGGSGGTQAGGTGGSTGGSAGQAGSTGSGGNLDGGSSVVGTSGGAIRDATGAFELVIPPGALLGDTSFSLSALAGIPDLPSEYSLIAGSAFHVEWMGAGFAPAATVTLRFETTATLALSASEGELVMQAGGGVAVQRCSDGTVTVYPTGESDPNSYEASGVPVCAPSGSGGSGGTGGGASGSASYGFGQPQPPTPAPPAIVSQPASVTVLAGSAAVFSVSATGSAPLSYQWRRGGTDLGLGATGSSYVLSPAMPSDQGARFSVRVSNAYGSVISVEAVLSVDHCHDVTRDGDESDADCGGSSCPKCDPGRTCNGSADCASGICDADNRCSGASCADGVQNGSETDIDCGGGCLGCGFGSKCAASTDCLGQSCLVAQDAKRCAQQGACAICQVISPDGLSCVPAADGTDPAEQCRFFLSGSSCAAESCQCPSGRTACETPVSGGAVARACVDVESDRDHCGQCSIECGWSCVTHACVPVTDLIAGDRSCLRQQSGAWYCWGYLVGDTVSGTVVRTPTLAPDLAAAIEVDAGGGTTCFREASGVVSCFGRNDYGQLGDGTTTPRTTALPVSGLTDAVEIANGYNSICARRSSGQVVCWGMNSWGQLGDGTTTNRSTPVSVSGLSDAVEITAGGLHACARRSSGQVVCWGSNSFGALGDGTRTERHTPVAVSGLSDAIAIAAEDGNSCAIRASGQVVCWGQNTAGYLGDGTTTHRETPVPVVGLADAVEIGAGHGYYCARRTSGDVACWGSGDSGRIGDGTAQPRPTPVPVIGVTDAVQIAVGTDHACARLGNDRILCWGDNTYGAIGNGGSGAVNSPVRVLPP